MPCVYLPGPAPAVTVANKNCPFVFAEAMKFELNKTANCCLFFMKSIS